MLEKVNVSRIVADHFNTLRNFESGRISVADIVLFFGVPIAVATALCYFGKLMNKDVVNALVAAYAILVGMLLNLLILILTAIRRERTHTHDPDVKVQFSLKLDVLEETFANISYCTLIGIVVTCVLVVCLVHNQWIRIGTSFFVYAVSGNFVLTLLMILKRVHKLLATEIPEQPSRGIR